jgi:hypothetical protein
MLKRIFFSIIAAVALCLPLQGCAGNLNTVQYDYIKLVSETTPHNYGYSITSADVGDVAVYKSFNGNFQNTGSSGSAPVFIAPAGSGLIQQFKTGETGQIIVGNQTSGKAATTFNGVVAGTAKQGSGTYLEVTLTGSYDASYSFNAVSGTFQVTVRDKKNCLRVPVAAVKYYGSTAVVGVYKSGVCSDQIVKTGMKGDDYIEITAGLKAGQQVVTGIASD